MDWKLKKQIVLKYCRFEQHWSHTHMTQIQGRGG